MNIFKKNNKKEKDAILLRDLYIGQMGKLKPIGEGYVSWEVLEKNPYIAYTKHRATSEYNYNTYGIDIFSNSGYNFFKDFDDDYILTNIYLYMVNPLSFYANEEEKMSGIITKQRISEILYNLNNSRENLVEYSSDVVLSSILSIIEKIKKTNLIVENKEMYFATLTNLATNYVSRLIEFKSRDYNLGDTSEILIGLLQQDIIKKLNIITAEIGKEPINNETLTRILEKK